jgi:hypothetical protein
MAIKFVNDFVAQLQSGLGATDTTATLTTEMYNKLGEMASEDYFCAMLSMGRALSMRTSRASRQPRISPWKEARKGPRPWTFLLGTPCPW